MHKIYRTSPLFLLVAAGLLLMMANPPELRAQAQKFVISPNGTDDTPSIQAAMTACQGVTPHCVIRLMEGDFILTPVEADDFRGSIVGAGMNKTNITLKPGFQIQTGFFFQPPSPSNPHPQMFTFRGGDVTIMDLTMKAHGQDPFPPYCYFPGVCFTQLQSFISVFALPGSTDRTNSRIERVQLLAEQGPTGGVTSNARNTNNAIAIGGQFFQAKMEYGGTHVIKDCFVDWSHIFLLGANEVKFSLDHNTFRHSSSAADVGQVSDSDISLTHNDIEASWTGIGVTQFTFYDPDGWVPLKPSRYQIAGNRIRIAGNTPNPGEGIFVSDQFQLLAGDSQKRMVDVTITNNSVEMQAGALGGIDLWSVDNARVAGNVVKGAGDWGIGATGVTNSQFLGNYVDAFDATGGQIFLSGPGVATGGDSGYDTPVTNTFPATSNAFVLAGAHDVVVDQGTNNTVKRR
ncbi:hypothetical protein [Occallatibacter riparius]|uniref:Right handed beta helix domain-containing protein n=1 Tax=Occallatibacter riparius TaxID=1002689 RepID=A0A9J7BRD7_9BACT|nr:hypothetical protein [Occallatibacter riparius]UWZ84322.1 hypothetical protein MOP44_27720 [Occallatibacter riparius]